jgi:hypothetical protein
MATFEKSGVKKQPKVVPNPIKNENEIEVFVFHMEYKFKIDKINESLIDVEIYDPSLEQHNMIKVNDENGLDKKFVAYATFSKKHPPRIRFNIKTRTDTANANEALFYYIYTHRELFADYASKQIKKYISTQFMEL